MKETATTRTGLLLPALLAALLCGPASAQERAGGEDHRMDAAPTGAHSRGWAAAMKLKDVPVEPKFPEVGTGIERHVLANGLVIYLAEDHRLPLVQLELLFRGGEAHEGQEEWGLARLTGGQMRDGGTEDLSPEELDDRLAFLAATLSTDIGEESGSASLDVLRANFEEALPLFAGVVMRPRFDEARLRIAKRRQVFALMHQNDNPGRILGREYLTLLYGPTHPRGRQLTPDRVQAIAREDLVRVHRRFVRPNQAWLAAVGDFDAAKMLATLRRTFGTWEAGPPVETELPKADRVARPGVYLVDRPITQSNIAVGHLGVDRTEPDRYAIDVMNAILGGGSFSSRITQRVRSDEGLAYSARTRYETSDRDIGTFQATVQTKTESTTRAIDLILEEIAEIRRPGSVTRDEFDTAREARLYSFVFRFEDPLRNVVRLMSHEMERLPPDQDRRDFEGYRSVTPAAVEAAALKHLRPEALSIFVVGDASELAGPLARYGEVRPVELRDFGGGPGRRMPRGGGE